MSRFVVMFALVMAGELVFGLPFHTARFFRPTLLELFNISVTELGDMFALYGIAAALSYFPGGALADRFSARGLMTASLFATALGGLYMMTIPGKMGLTLLYGYWGVTTVFLLWGAMLRATRIWGGAQSQGLAFGLLEGGRGLISALVAVGGVVLLANFMPDNANLATALERRSGFQSVVLLYTVSTFATGVLTWFAIPAVVDRPDRGDAIYRNMRYVLRRPLVWAQAAVIVCAYCLYKGLDNYSLYANQVLGLDEVDSARLFSYGAWLRPIAALAAGMLVDKIRGSTVILCVFASLVAVYLGWSLSDASGVATLFIYVNFFASFVAVFALRGVYFALLEENRTPHYVTGAAVGLVSFIGFTPDIFFASITGRIIDANPGLAGFQHYFQFLGAVAAAGVVTVVVLIWLRRRGVDTLWPESHPVLK